MAIYNSLLGVQPPLTSTRNKLLSEDNYENKHTSVDSSLKLQQDDILPSWLKSPVYSQRLLGIKEKSEKLQKPAKKRKKLAACAPPPPGAMGLQHFPCHSPAMRFDCPDSMDEYMDLECDAVDYLAARNVFQPEGVNRGPLALFGSSLLQCSSNIPANQVQIQQLPQKLRRRRLQQQQQQQPQQPQQLFTFGAATARSTTFGFAEAFAKSADLSFHMKTTMPVYKFEREEVAKFCDPEFRTLDANKELLFLSKQNEVNDMKLFFISSVCTSLLHSPNFKNHSDPYRLFLSKLAENIISLDPEFILKVSLYARLDLNIKSTSNFLIALSSHQPACNHFLKKYFSSCIRLPSDWLEVAAISSTFSESCDKIILPSALRRVLKSTFEKFDEHQLAKYNKHKKRKPQRDTAEAEVGKIRCSAKPLTLKKMIRLLHITSPVNMVMSLLGKKYPENDASFQKSGLKGYWKPEKAGKRMKLQVPETWETTLSTEGNNAIAWQTLIDNEKLPYMAMLRNLKNLITCGMSKKYHKKMLKRISDKNAVIRSRQFPLRFYTAYESLIELENSLDPQKRSSSCPQWKSKQAKKFLERTKNIDLELIKLYRNAVSDALETSIHHNIDPIGGTTLVICDLIYPYNDGPIENFNEKAFQNCILLGLMCLRSCECCEMKVLYGAGYEQTVNYSDKPFLENMNNLCALLKGSSGISKLCLAEKRLIISLSALLESYLCPSMLLNTKVNNIILLLGSTHIDHTKISKVVDSFLHKYRNIVNPDLLFVQINIASPAANFNTAQNATHKNVYLAGFSDHILKFISQKGSSNQLSYVENIDQKYDLQKLSCGTLKKSAIGNTSTFLSMKSSELAWKSIRIFISSTFRDMHGERDLLLRYVFPELKARASLININVIGIDLRWGITEEYSSSKSCAEFCLREASCCDLFIGLLGERYGTVYEFDPPDDLEFDWMRKYLLQYPGASITELEMMAGVSNCQSRAYFYIRDNAFESHVPLEYKSHFVDEDLDARQKLSELKFRIRKSGWNLYDGYTCSWGGIVNDKPFVSNLDNLGKCILENLWGVIEKLRKDENLDAMASEYRCHLSQMELHSNCVGEESTPLFWLLKETKSKQGIFAVTGRAGCGKTAFIAKVLNSIGTSNVIPFFIGATPRSTDLAFMLHFIANAISQVNPVSSSFDDIKHDIINNFSDVLAHGGQDAHEPLVLLIDGLDKLDETAQTLDWLPYNMSSRIILICSTNESSTAYKMLQNRASNGFPIYFVPLNPLSIEDRKLFVKNYLFMHRKSLDESTFQNQMIQLITKTDCGYPLYANLACDYLCMFATFDNLMSAIQRFPSTLEKVWEEVLIQMESQFGMTLVQKALTLLSTVKEGLNEDELHLLLSISVNSADINMPLEDLMEVIEHFRLEDMLSPVKFCSFTHMIRTFILRCCRKDSLKISSVEFLQVLKKVYGNKGHYAGIQSFHKLLAAHYKVLCDPNGNKRWTGTSAVSFRSLPFHLYHGQCYNELENILCSLDFLYASFNSEAADDIQNYYLLLLNEGKKHATTRSGKALDLDLLEDYYNFILKNHHIITKYPVMIYQQALNVSKTSKVHFDQPCKISTLECLTRKDGNSQLSLSFLKKITCVTVHSSQPFAAAGDEDGRLKIFNTENGKVLTSLKQHSFSITSVFFIGNDKLCTSSLDNTICIWSIIDYVLLEVLKGHTQHISGCTCDVLGKFILSSSWDRTIRFWRVQDGAEVSTLTDFSCPVNCVAHHPELQEFVCGLWDKTIEIWNSVSLKKRTVLVGHSGSVQIVTYSSDGLQIVSSSVGSEILIWSSLYGLKIGHIKRHGLLVNSIAFCLKNDFFVTASDDCTLKIWSNQQNPNVLTIEQSRFCPIQFMKIVKHNCLAVAFKNDEVWLFDLVDGHVIATVEGLLEPVSCFGQYLCEDEDSHSTKNEFSSSFLFGNSKGKIMAFDCSTSSLFTIGDVSSSITCLLYTSRFLFYGSANGDVGLFTANGRESAIAYSPHGGSVSTLSIKSVSVDNIWGLSASTDKTLILWKIQYGDSLQLSVSSIHGIRHKDYVTSCCMFTAGEDSKEVDLVTGSSDNTVALWSDGNQKILEGLQSAVVNVYAIKNLIVGCSQDGSVAIWEKSGCLISKLLNILEAATIVAWDLKSDMADVHDLDAVLAFVHNNGSISLKHPFKRSLLSTLEGHSKAVTSCSVSENGNIFSSSLDKTVTIWKMSQCTSVTSHEGRVTATAVCKMGKFAFTADMYGNVFLWTIDETNDSFVQYQSCKKYIGGHVISLELLSGSRCACAVNFYSDDHKKSSITILSIKKLSDEEISPYVIMEDFCQSFSSEVTCMNYHEFSSAIIVGMKNGSLIIWSKDMNQTQLKISNDWILKICGSQNDSTFCTAEANGIIKLFSLTKVMESKINKEPLPSTSFKLESIGNSQLAWITAICSDVHGKFYIGDSKGYLRVWHNTVVTTKQLHTEAITEIWLCGLTMISCSYDKTIKIWNITTVQQIGQFNAATPVTCLAVQNVNKGSEDKSFPILYGSSVGDFHLLKWMPLEDSIPDSVM